MDVADLTQKSDEHDFPMAMARESQSNETDNCQGETSQALCQSFGANQDKTDTSNHSPKQPTRISNHHSNSNQRAITADQEKPHSQPTTSNGSLATDDVISWQSMESWDPLRHVDYCHIDAHGSNMRTLTLPHDLKFVKMSELLPMAYDDFTKCVKEDLCWSLSESSMLADDDCVVPSLSPAFQDAKNHYLDSCSSLSQTSSDWSQEYGAMDIELKKKGKSQSPASTYGTLNWGLSPTIIFKTPGPEISVDVGNVPMKCSITEGNVELITPPQANSSKLRRCCRRMSRLHRSRKRLHFDGVQEVPTNDNQEMDENPGSDHVPEDPMWFEEDDEWDCAKKENLKMYEGDLEQCYANLSNVLPKNTEATSRQQVLNVAVEHIKELQRRINDINQVKSPNKHNDYQGPEDVFGVLPQFSWSDIDEPSYEIQAILENLVPTTNAAVELDQSPTTPLSKKATPKKKRKCRKTTRQKRTKKTKNKPLHEKRDLTEINTSKFAVENDSFTAVNSQEMRNNRWNNTTFGCKADIALESAVISGENSQFTSPSPTACTKGSSVTPSKELLSPHSSYYPIAGLMPLQTIGKPLILPKPLMATPFSPPFTSCNTVSTSGNMATTSGDMMVTSGYISSSGYISPSGSPLLTSGFQLIAPRMSIPDSSPSTSFPVSPLTQGSISLVTSGGLPLARNMMSTNTPLTWLQSSPVQLVSPQELWDNSDSEGRHERNEKVKRKTNGYMLYCKKKRPSLFMENPELKSKPGDITRLLSQNWKKLTKEEKSLYIEEAMKEAMNSEWIEWTNETPY